jgi:hypothetical protein
VTASEYLQQANAAMAPSTYAGDCLKHARAIAELLRAEGKSPWIARLRKVEGDFHHPLIPLRFHGRSVPAWTTHYVCCCDGDAWGPILGEPEPLVTYSQAVFGQDFDLTPVEDPAMPPSTRA